MHEVELNVLLQNIDLINGQDVRGLLRFGKVTCTTAHEAYTNTGTRASLACRCTDWQLAMVQSSTLDPVIRKKKTLMVSPDEHPLKELVLHKIAEALPSLRIQVVRDLLYDDYARLAGRVKWS